MNSTCFFQLAESSADPYGEKACINWFYLNGNDWKQLRIGFELLDDATNGLLEDGIVEFSLPFDIDKEHTVMPDGMFWIKASTAERAEGVSETLGVHAQGALVVYDNKK